MIEEDALYILRNTAWLGSNEKREEVEEAIETLAETLGLQQSVAEADAKEEEELKSAYESYLLVSKSARHYYRVCKINGKYGAYSISHIIDSCADESLEQMLNRLVELDIKPSYNNLNSFLDALAEKVNNRMEIVVKKGADNDT
jgi:hypothetical protein